MKLLIALFLLAAASGARGQTLRIVDAAVSESVQLADGSITVVPVQVRVYRSGVVCVTTPCPQGPPLQARFRLTVEIAGIASASLHAERTFRTHASHTLTLPLAIDGAPSASGEGVLWGTARLFRDGAAASCQRFRIAIDGPGSGRKRPLAQSDRHCTPRSP